MLRIKYFIFSRINAKNFWGLMKPLTIEKALKQGLCGVLEVFYQVFYARTLWAAAHQLPRPLSVLGQFFADGGGFLGITFV